MSDFIREVDEDYRRDRLIQLFSRFQVPLAVLAVLVIVGAGGWRIWTDRKIAGAEQDNARYLAAELLAKQGKTKDAEAAFSAIATSGPAGYAMLARMRAAELLAVSDPEGAAKAFDGIANDDALAQSMRDTARLRGAMIRVDSEDPKAFEQRYGRFSVQGYSFRNAMRELLALAAIKGGDLASAGKYLDQIAIDPRRAERTAQSRGGVPRSRDRRHRDGGEGSVAARFGDPGCRTSRGDARDSRHRRSASATQRNRDARDTAETLAIDRPVATKAYMFTIAIIGRPNVGKSTLFNRLVGKKLALVDDRPGVTRDRREGEAKLGDLRFTVIDTAGLEEGDAASLSGRTRAQTEAAIEGADGIFFVIDARVGLTPDDRAFAALVRRAGKPLILLANKAEGRAGSDGAMEAYQLGLGDPVALSAEHGEGLSELYAALLEKLPEQTALVEEEAADEAKIFDDDEDGTELDLTKPLKIAVVGRPNAGKSTLLNQILGENRLLTGPEAGLTRDAIGLDLTWRGRTLKMFDTAGLRRRARVEDKLEKLAGADALRAAKFAEVVVLLIDATMPFEKQDLTLADLIAREGRALVIGLNKWDLIEDKGGRLTFLREEANRLLPQVRGAPVVPLAGETGFGVERLMEAVMKVEETWNKRISTARLNRWLTATLEHHPPPAVAGRRIKIRYMTQLRARPPYFVIFGNQLEAMPTSYERFLLNGIREAFDLPGVPLRLSRKTSENPYEHRRTRQR